MGMGIGRVGVVESGVHDIVDEEPKRKYMTAKHMIALGYGQ